MGLLRDIISVQDTHRATSTTRSINARPPPPYSSTHSSSYTTQTGIIEPIYEYQDEENMRFDSSSSSSSSSPSSLESLPRTIDYVDNYVEGDVQIFGPEVERAQRHNSVPLPLTRNSETYGRFNEPVARFPPQFQKQVNTQHLYTPFRPILVVANSQNLVDGFQMVYFPEQMSSHDISMSDWQRFLEDIRRAAMPTSCYADPSRDNFGNTSYNGSSYARSNLGYLGDERKMSSPQNTGIFSDALNNRRRRRRSNDRDDGLIRLVIKLGAAYVDTRMEAKAGNNSTAYRNNCDPYYGYSDDTIPRSVASDDYSRLLEFIDRWNMMFFNNRSVHVQIRFPEEVRSEYDHFVRTYSREDARKVRRQAEQDGRHSLTKCRLIIRSL